MRSSLALTKPDGTIDELASVKLEILAFYSSEEKCVAQAMQLIVSEYDYYIADRESWTFSDVSMSVINAASRRAGQVYVCGLVAVLMVHLNEEENPASLNLCSEVASEIINNLDKATFVVPKENQWGFQEKALVSDPAKIRSYFRQYKRAAHVCAAKFIMGGSAEGHPLVKPLPLNLSYMSTVMQYQRIFEAWPITSDWNLWKIWYEGASFEPAYPPQNLHPDHLAYARELRDKLRPK